MSRACQVSHGVSDAYLICVIFHGVSHDTFHGALHGVYTTHPTGHGKKRGVFDGIQYGTRNGLSKNMGHSMGCNHGAPYMHNGTGCPLRRATVYIVVVPMKHNMGRAMDYPKP